MRSRNVWQALARPDYLLTSWPWRAAGYLLSSAPVGLAALVVIAGYAVVAGGLTLVLVGLPLLALLGLVGIPVAAVERWRLRLIDADPAPSGHRPPGRPGVVALLRTRYREQATWRELAYTLLFAVVLWPLDLLAAGVALAVALGLIATPSWWRRSATDASTGCSRRGACRRIPRRSARRCWGWCCSASSDTCSARWPAHVPGSPGCSRRRATTRWAAGSWNSPAPGAG